LVDDAALALVRDAPPSLQFSLLSFHDAVEPITDWGESISTVQPKLTNAKSGSRTALRLGLLAAQRRLENRPGNRAVVLFTDGRDSVGGPTQAEVLRAFETSHIRVFAVALETKDLDEAVLKELTEKTKGSYLSTKQQTALADCFRQLTPSLSKPIYRLVVPIGTGSWPLTLTIGRDPQAVSLRIPHP